MTPKEWRDTGLKFQPIFYRCNLNRDSGTNARLSLCETPARSGSQLKDSGRLIFY